MAIKEAEAELEKAAARLEKAREDLNAAKERYQLARRSAFELLPKDVRLHRWSRFCNRLARGVQAGEHRVRNFNGHPLNMDDMPESYAGESAEEYLRGE